MLWSRTGSLFDLLFWGLLTLVWWGGGWLLSAHLFGLRSRERLFSGLGIGLLLFILLSNLAAYLLPIGLAFCLAGLLVAGLGILAAWRSPLQPWFDASDLRVSGQWIGFTGLFALFMLINRGLGIFDDFLNIPLTSWLASGHFPPRFYLNPERIMDYHYGLHLLAASLERLGGMFPWLAFDLVKSLTLALAVVLAALWLRRFERRQLQLAIFLLVFVFAGGTRWLLLLAPEKTVQSLGIGLELQGSARLAGPDLASALVSPWSIEGDGPYPFAFAFVNGIYRPLTFALGSSAGMPYLAVALLLLLAPSSPGTQRRWRVFPGLVFGMLLASLALVVEHLFVMLWGGLAATMLLAGLAHGRKWKNLYGLGWVLLPGLILAPTMGGVLTGVALAWLQQKSVGGLAGGLALPEMSLRLPPAVLSAHLGVLELTNGRHLWIALAEIGPVLLAAPPLLWLVWRQVKNRRWMLAGLNIGALIGFLAAIFIQFASRERDLSRLMDSALSLWLLLALTYLAAWSGRRGGRLPAPARVALGGVGLVTVLGGLALFPTQLIAVAQPQRTGFIANIDARFSQQQWNKLEPETWVLDLDYPYRSVVVLARGSGPAYLDAYRTLPGFRDLLAEPWPAEVARQGYAYVYIDEDTWQELAPELQEAYIQACVRTVLRLNEKPDIFRWLVDIRQCR